MPAPKGPANRIASEARMFVKRTVPNREPEIEHEAIEVRVFETVPANVQAKAKRTINLGDYESVTLEVGVAYPCYKEEVEDLTALEYVTALVGGYLSKEVQKVQEGMKAGG